MKLSYINLLLTLTIDIIGVIFAVEKYRTSAMLSNALYWTCDVARRCSQCIGMPCCIYSKDTEHSWHFSIFNSSVSSAYCLSDLHTMFWNIWLI